LNFFKSCLKQTVFQHGGLGLSAVQGIINAHEGCIRVIVMSGYTEESVLTEDLKKQVYGFLQKPFSQTELYQEIWKGLSSE